MQLQTQEVPQKQYHFVYRITNLVNGKYYIGKHSTYDLEDGYMGSGNLILKAINKYGKENFSREILYYCSTSEEAYEKEKFLVSYQEIDDPQCYNIICGGNGGWEYCNNNHFSIPISIQFKNNPGLFEYACKKGVEILKEKRKDIDFQKKQSLKIKNGLINFYYNGGTSGFFK